MELVISGTKVKPGVRSRNLTKCNMNNTFQQQSQKMLPLGAQMEALQAPEGSVVH